VSFRGRDGVAPLARPVEFSTAPAAGYTHWGQQVCAFLSCACRASRAVVLVLTAGYTRWGQQVRLVTCRAVRVFFLLCFGPTDLIIPELRECAHSGSSDSYCGFRRAPTATAKHVLITRASLLYRRVMCDRCSTSRSLSSPQKTPPSKGPWLWFGKRTTPASTMSRSVSESLSRADSSACRALSSRNPSPPWETRQKNPGKIHGRQMWSTPPHALNYACRAGARRYISACEPLAVGDVCLPPSRPATIISVTHFPNHSFQTTPSEYWCITPVWNRPDRLPLVFAFGYRWSIDWPSPGKGKRPIANELAASTNCLECCCTARSRREALQE